MFAKRRTLQHNPKLERRLDKMALTDVIDWCDNNGTMIARCLDNIRKGNDKEVACAEACKSVNELHQAVLHIAKRLEVLIDS